jgi:serine/threonine-protein kinase
MTSLTLEKRKIRVSGCVAPDNEEARAFLQARLALFGLCVFVLAGGSWAVLAGASLFVSDAPAQHHPFSPGGTLHLIDGLLGGVLWQLTRRGERRIAWLRKLDMGFSLVLIVIWSATGACLPDPTGAHIAMLCFTTGTLARAIVVPSSPERTLAIGLIGGGVLIAFPLYGQVGQSPVMLTMVATACWTTAAIVLATLASRTIFGLRRAAEEARVLGQYTLESKIGEGGMGVVWRASHALLRRPTAVKLLAPHRTGESAIRRFEREVQLTARLTHPNSVAIYDYGRTRDGIFYYAMEFLEGTDLQRLVAEYGPQPPGRVVHVLCQITSALAEAHDLGLVHRDVKPANILLAPRKNEHEVAKIVDFGLVKHVDPALSHPGDSAINTITGTPLYLAPEAILSPDVIDHRSDLYALGAVGWCLLVGRPPFEANTVVEVCSKHLHEIPARPSEALGREIPRDLEDIILACLEKKPADRPSDARALRSLLQACSAQDTWTTSDAAVWWTAGSVAESADPASDPSGPRTIALDIAARGDTVESAPLFEPY